MKLTLHFEDDTAAARTAGYAWALKQPANALYDAHAAYRAFGAAVLRDGVLPDEQQEALHDAFETGAADAGRVLMHRQFLSISDAAQRAGVNVSYVRAEIKAGRLQAEKPGTEWLIRGVDFAAWLANPRRGTRSGRADGARSEE